jgi:hypothetical protein
MNFLARALLFPRTHEFDGAYLFERVRQRSRAQLILPSFDINWFAGREAEVFDHLELRNDDDGRHLFVDSRDEPAPLPVADAVWLKTSATRDAAAGGIICVPYIDSVDDYSYYFGRFKRELDYGSSFVGGATSRRTDILAHIKAQACFATYFQIRNGYFLDRHLRADGVPYSKAEVVERRHSREQFVRAAMRSRYILALPGFATNTSRFFESLSMGVAPILVANDTALPFSPDIPYDDFVLRADEDPEHPERTAAAVISLIEDHWEEAVSRGRLGRFYYDTYLSRANVLYRLHSLLPSLLGVNNKTK